LDDGYIIESVKEILQCLKENRVRTTFFVVSEIFEWYPELIYSINEEGHEIAFHTFGHQKITNLQVLNEEIKKSRRFIDEFKPKGFRAPEITIRREFFGVLSDNGFFYDSSTYGDFSLVRKISGLLEIPVSSFRLFGNSKKITFPRSLSLNLVLKEIPFGSGYLIGLLGSGVSFFIDQVNCSGKPAILFIHPWQISVSKKKMAKCNMKMLPYLVNRRKAFRALLSRYEFTTLLDLYRSLNSSHLDAS